MEKLLHIDTFAGIGGFSLAADRVFGEMDHIFCEIQPFCQAQLRNNWPKSKIYGDIRTLTNAKDNEQQLAVERKQDAETAISRGDCFLLTGGFPCQPFSSAGQRKGTEDDRHLWPEMLRVIRDFRPRWVIGENVDGLVTWNGGLVFFLSNTYYGWNQTAQSGGERVWDIVWNTLIILGLFGVIARSVAVEVFEQMSMEVEINGEIKAKTDPKE